MTETVGFDQWLTPGEARRLVGVPTKTLAAWADKGLVTTPRRTSARQHRRCLEPELDMVMIETACRGVTRPTAEIARDVARKNGHGAWRLDELGQRIRDALG